MYSRLVQFRFVESSLKRKIQAALSTSVSIDAHSFVRKGSRAQRTQSLRAELFTSLFLWLPCDETFPSRNESDQALRSQRRELRLAESPTTVRVVPERARTTLFRGGKTRARSRKSLTVLRNAPTCISTDPSNTSFRSGRTRRNDGPDQEFVFCSAVAALRPPSGCQRFGRVQCLSAPASTLHAARLRQLCASPQRNSHSATVPWCAWL